MPSFESTCGALLHLPRVDSMDSAADLRGIDILHCSWRGAAGIRRPASGSQSKRQYPDLEHRQGSVTGPSTRWWSTALGHSAICAARVSARATVPITSWKSASRRTRYARRLPPFRLTPASCLDTRIPEMVSCQEYLDTGEDGLADRVAAAGDAGDGVADEAHRRGCGGALGEEGRDRQVGFRKSIGTVGLTPAFTIGVRVVFQDGRRREIAEIRGKQSRPRGRAQCTTLTMRPTRSACSVCHTLTSSPHCTPI